MLSDGKGVLILHADGDFISQIFYIRKGIGYYYRLNFEKINSNLGLPISSESEMMDSTNTKTDFENGYIKWISKEVDVIKPSKVIGLGADVQKYCPNLCGLYLPAPALSLNNKKSINKIIEYIQ